MILHVHKHLTDTLDIVKVANEFVEGSEHKVHLFWTFYGLVPLYYIMTASPQKVTNVSFSVATFIAVNSCMDMSK